MPEGETLGPDKNEEIESFVTSWMSDDRIPATSLAVVRGSDTVYAEGFGARDLETNTAATVDTLYGIGSCSKSFTALGIMQLVEDDKLDLQDPVDQYIPHLAEVPGDPITIHELLSHTSGMPSDGYLTVLIRRLTGVREIEVPLSSPDDFRRHVEGSSEERRLEDEPFFYYNTGFTLLGLIIESVTGLSFADYVRKNILEPLDMTRSGFAREHFEAESDRMTPYYKEDGETVPSPLSFDDVLYAPGGLISSVTEMADYVKAIMNGGRYGDVELLGSEHIATMLEPHSFREALLDDSRINYGYGWSVRPYLDDQLIAHGGSMAVTTASTGFLKEAGIGVVLCANYAPEHHPTVALQGVLAIMQDQDPYRTVPQLALDSKMDPLTGTYESYRGIWSATIERDGADLTMTTDGFTSDQSYVLHPKSLDPDDRVFEAITAAGERVKVEFEVESPAEVDLFFRRWRLHKTGRN